MSRCEYSRYGQCVVAEARCNVGSGAYGTCVIRWKARTARAEIRVRELETQLKASQPPAPAQDDSYPHWNLDDYPSNKASQPPAPAREGEMEDIMRRVRERQNDEGECERCEVLQHRLDECLAKRLFDHEALHPDPADHPGPIDPPTPQSPLAVVREWARERRDNLDYGPEVRLAFGNMVSYLDGLSRARVVEGVVRDDNPNSIDIIAIEAPIKPGTRVTVVIEEGRDA